MRIGLVGTGAIAWKHAQAYRNIGFPLVACTNRGVESGQNFATQTGAKFVRTFEEISTWSMSAHSLNSAFP